MAAATIKKRSEGLLAFVKDYRTISSVPIPKLKKINVKQFLNTIHLLMKQALEEASITFQLLPIPANATINADSKLIEQVLINLINNSIHALEGRNTPTIKVSCVIENDKTILIITDNGKGIEEEILHQIFIPFFTTKEDGSGIGLSLSKQIIQIHGGGLSVRSVVGEETVFVLWFG